MATLFLDYEGGNDNYGGTSFELLASGTNGRITTATFSAATANFPNDGSLINQYLSIFNGTIYAVYNITAWVSATSLTIAQISGGTALANQAVDRQYYIGGRWQTTSSGATAVRIVPGDTLRLMGSPAPTSLGINGTWTSSAFQNGVGVSTVTNASPIVITTGTAHGLVTGDTVSLSGALGNTAANGMWEVTVTSTTQFSLDGSTGNGVYTSGASFRKRTNFKVQLASALTQTIASTGPRSAWTASTNVTATLNTANFKEHQYSDSIDIAAAFTTGKAAYFPTGTLNLSGYQQVSFWISQTAGTIGAAGAVSIALCSDLIGATAVNTINIPNIAALNNWTQITVNTGAALGSSIRSIAFYVNTDNGAQTFLINNIIACKAASAADSLTLASLIGKNRSDDTWYGIQSIKGTRVMLDNVTSITPFDGGTARGYNHSSGTQTVTTYKREAIRSVLQVNNNAGVIGGSESGTFAAPMVFSGGWNRTDMSTQTLETWFDGQSGLGNGIATAGGFMTFDTMGFVRYTAGALFINSGPYFTLNNFRAGSCTNGLQTSNTSQLIYVNGLFIQGCLTGITTTNTPGQYTVSNASMYNCNTAISVSTPINFTTGEIRNCIGAITQERANNNTFQNLTTTDNSTVITQAGPNQRTYWKNCIINETIEVTYNTVDSYLYSHNHDNVAGNHKIFANGGLISADTTLTHGTAGFSWKMSVTSTNRFVSLPLVLSLAKVACAANSLVTIKAWMYRDNAGLTMQLVCKGGQLAGVPNDVTSSVSATGAWEEETITFTPTEQGVVEILAYAYGGSTFNGWVDDMTISQA
jgi:hypothetical protein